MSQTPVHVAGEEITTEKSVEVRSPFDGALVGEVPLCDEGHVDRACRAAAAALSRESFPQHTRAEVLERAAALLRGRTEDFARRITAEGGKPIRTARAEVARCIDTLVFSAVEARTLCGEMVPMDASQAGAGALGFSLRVPLGVVAAITPFNFPLNLVAHKVAPAIAAGCPVVLKPAPQTPLTGIDFVALLREAGMPADWVSVVTDAGTEAGAPLVAHDTPKMVTFTGSAGVGWHIAGAAPKKRIALELGSNAPVIVEPDADLEEVARKVRAAGYGHAGQSCISVQRVIVHQQVHERFVEALREEVRSLAVGDPSDEGTDVGPLIRRRDAERVGAWIREAAEGGGTLVTGGEVDGSLVQPAVVDGPPDDSKLWREEVFGPVVGVRSYARFDDALKMANDSGLRLQAGVFTRDIRKAMDAVRSLDFGGVLVNQIPTTRVDQQPYGGVAEAGNTREGPAWAVREMTELRFVRLEAG
ncbi:MAG: aldehyde dehydrogenase family protein [Polyangiales bacterium]